jgi:hypothetical protein
LHKRGGGVAIEALEVTCSAYLETDESQQHCISTVLILADFVLLLPTPDAWGRKEWGSEAAQGNGKVQVRVQRKALKS